MEAVGWACGSSTRGSTWRSQPRRRATAKSSPPVFWPATTIRPFGASATALPNVAAPKSTVALPPAPNAGVERSVGVQARDGDVLAVLRVAGDDDLAVRLARRAAERVGERAEGDRRRAAAAEARVERAVGLQARDGHRRAPARVARDDDVAVGLHEHGVDAAAAGQRHAPVAAEVRVEHAGRAQPRDHGAGGRRPSDDEDAPVGLAGDRLAELGRRRSRPPRCRRCRRSCRRRRWRSGARPGCCRPRAPRSRRAGSCRSAPRPRP